MAEDFLNEEELLDEIDRCIDEVKESIDPETIEVKADDTELEAETSIGRKMAYCREILRFTRKEMADVFEITTIQLSDYENDICEPPLNTLMLYARYFEIPMEDFVDEFVTLQEFAIKYCIFHFVKFKTIYKYTHNK